MKKNGKSTNAELIVQYDLRRFVVAQNRVYERVLNELRAGKKRSHWIWFIFPQIDGLGFSSTAKNYAIKSRQEASAYLAHPVLGPHMEECVTVMLTHKGTTVSSILGYPDDLKFRSSMTLFSDIAPDSALFESAIDVFFSGNRDAQTLAILQRLG